MVNAVALDCCGALVATRVENIGESAMTTIPQNNRKQISRVGFDWFNTSGEVRQQMPEAANARAATLLGPMDWDHNPPAMQERLPMPMMAKAVPDVGSE